MFFCLKRKINKLNLKNQKINKNYQVKEIKIPQFNAINGN